MFGRGRSRGILTPRAAEDVGSGEQEVPPLSPETQEREAEPVFRVAGRARGMSLQRSPAEPPLFGIGRGRGKLVVAAAAAEELVERTQTMQISQVLQEIEPPDDEQLSSFVGIGRSRGRGSLLSRMRQQTGPIGASGFMTPRDVSASEVVSKAASDVASKVVSESLSMIVEPPESVSVSIETSESVSKVGSESISKVGSESVSKVSSESGPISKVSSGGGGVPSKLASDGAGGSGPGKLASTERPQPPSLPPAAISEVVQILPTRRGEKGAKVGLTTNFLRLKVDSDKGIFEYHVTFDPTFDAIGICKKVVNKMQEYFGPCRTFDGAKLSLPHRLANDDISYQVDHPNLPNEKVTVRVKYVKKSAVADTIHFYNVLIRKVLEMTGLKEINRNHFDPAKIHQMPQHRLEVWSGYDTAVDEYEGGLMVCVETVHRVLQQSSVLDHLRELKRSSPQAYREKLAENIIGRSILTRYNNTFYKIDDIEWEQTPASKFPLRSGGEITFIDYFRSHHSQTICEMDQPLLISRIKPRKNDPTGESKAILLIPELSYATGLTDEITSNFTIMKALIERSKISPMQRLQHIRDFVTRIKKNQAASDLLRSWGLTINDNPEQFGGRVVPPPPIMFNSKCTKPAPSDNDFSRQSTSGPCFRPVNLKSWKVFHSAQDQDKVKKMIDAIKQVAPLLGMGYTPPEPVIVKGSGRFLNGNDFRKSIQEMAKQGEVQFLIIILPQSRDELYSAVKKQCLVKSSIPSQVIIAKTLSNEKRLRSIIQKVILQINCKLGGALWALQVPLKENIMFVGIDAYHDPKRRQKSVMAMVASLDTQCTSYYSKPYFQAPHQESGDTISVLFELCLAAYYERNHFYPDRIVVFRDGVGDGQLPLVRGHEIPQMQNAIYRVCEEGVKFSFIVTQKRIIERIFRTAGETLTNPEPGTVVDHTVTRLGVYDFFLISQSVREGTVGPTHYIVLEDSGENKPDLLQRFSFALTYMYFNWAGTIRVPAVCQNAHKLAQLCGKHLLETPKQDMDGKLYYL